MLTVEVGHPDRLTYVRLRGDVDGASAAQLSTTLDALIDCGPTALVIDLRATEFFGAAGLRAVRHAAERVEPMHGSVRIVGASAQAKRLFDIALRSHPSPSLRL